MSDEPYLDMDSTGFLSISLSAFRGKLAPEASSPPLVLQEYDRFFKFEAEVFRDGGLLFVIVH